jgi:hypothetical protein
VRQGIQRVLDCSVEQIVEVERIVEARLWIRPRAQLDSFDRGKRVMQWSSERVKSSTTPSSRVTQQVISLSDLAVRR